MGRFWDDAACGARQAGHGIIRTSVSITFSAGSSTSAAMTLGWTAPRAGSVTRAAATGSPASSPPGSPPRPCARSPTQLSLGRSVASFNKAHIDGVMGV